MPGDQLVVGKKKNKQRQLLVNQAARKAILYYLTLSTYLYQVMKTDECLGGKSANEAIHSL